MNIWVNCKHLVDKKRVIKKKCHDLKEVIQHPVRLHWREKLHISGEWPLDYN